MTQSADAIYDELTVVLLLARDALRDLNFGVSAWVTLDNDIRLVFEKDGNWELFIVYPDHTKKLLAHAQVSIRLQAAKKLPELKEALKKAYEERTKEVREAISSTKDFINELKAEGNPWLNK